MSDCRWIDCDKGLLFIMANKDSSSFQVSGSELYFNIIGLADIKMV